VCQKTGEHEIAIQACGDALSIDSRCSKALYRRAMSLIAPVSAGGLEFDRAIEDLSNALRYSPDDRTIAGQLKRLRADQRKQKKNDKKTFSGMFGRGEVYVEQNEKKILGNIGRKVGDVGGGGGGSGGGGGCRGG
jgi:hypothetical protein